MRYWILLLLMATLTACSNQAWQHSLKEGASQDCYQLPSSERERCLQRLQEAVKP